MMARGTESVVSTASSPQPHRYLVFGASAALAGFPIAFSVEEGEAQGWFAVHVLFWYVAIAWRRQGAAEGGAAIA